MVDKPWFDKLNKIADWIIRIVVINVFIVISTIGIITFYAGLKMAYDMFTDYTEDKHTPLFKGMWTYFKEDFLKKLGYGTLLIVTLFVGISSLLWYNKNLTDNFDIFIGIGYSIMLMFNLGVYLIFLYSLTVTHVFKEASLKNVIRLSFYLAGKYFLRTILIIIINIAPFLLLLSYYTAPIFVLAGLSIPAVLNVLITKKPVRFLKGEEKNV